VQLAAAYGAIANDGVLLWPTLVREIRDPSGEVLYRHSPEPVRRVLRSEVAAQLREFLHEASSVGGTGSRAQLAGYGVLGKTGTARRFQNGHYVEHEYTSSFAGLFPADNPQLVVIVKLDNPKGAYYGGETAAPVTRTMLEQALASHRVAINRGRLAQSDSAMAQEAEPVPAAPRGAPVIAVSWPYKAETESSAPVPVPDVVGRSVREAALAIHRRGFRMSLRGLGRVTRTVPEGGQTGRPGTSIAVWAE
jgi:cell division protein FtsI (penicillin-binding protein 3)